MNRHVTKLGIAGLVGIVLAFATATASAATLKAPVVKEVFTPLPCTHDQTTLAAEGCAEQSILKSDKQIDKLNAQIFATLSTTSAKKDFIAGHTAWFTYRQAFCASEGDIYQGGTEAGVIESTCSADINTAHVKELKSFLGGLQQG